MNIVIAGLASVAFAALLILQWRKAEFMRRAEERRAQLVERLADRLGDREEFIAFARSPEGRALLGRGDGHADIVRRLLLMAQGAILLAALGAGFLVIAWSAPGDADLNLVREAEEARYWGTMCLALSAGLGIGFWFAQARAKAWGLLPR